MTGETSHLPRWAARVAEAPLWAHAVVLLVGLLAIVPVVGTGVSYSADEGVAIIQATSLSDGDGWVVPHPVPEVDPSDALYPLEHATLGDDGPVAYAKHPAYPWLLARVDQLGGQPGMVLLSVLGTWAAAVAAAVVAQQLGGLGRTSLWVAGALSPLLFNGYWVIAHSVAAAAIGGATALAIAATSRSGASRSGASSRK